MQWKLSTETHSNEIQAFDWSKPKQQREHL